jgi:hypothetical protein
MSDFRTYLYLTDKDGEEHEVDVRVYYDATYQSARISGPPEYCYPSESEMDITDIHVIGDLPPGCDEPDFDTLSVEQQDRIEVDAWEHYFARSVDDE